jgi:hypothetical protein
MSAVPRIVFTRFTSSESAKLVPWIEHLRRVVGAPDPAVRPSRAEKPGSPIVWHLVAANNRHLARSARIFGSFESARSDARQTVAAGIDLKVIEVSEASRGSYGWYAAEHGKPILTCSRWYDNERDRRHAIELARRSLAIAEIHTGARFIDDSAPGKRRLIHG